MTKCLACQRPFRNKKSPGEKARATFDANLRKPMLKGTVYKSKAK